MNQPESRESVWVLAIAPSVWACHFMACYLTAAIIHAKFDAHPGSPNFVRGAMMVYTAAALIAISVTAFVGIRRVRARSISHGPHDNDTHEDRHSFLGFAMLLLSGLSAIATLFVGAVGVLVDFP